MNAKKRLFKTTCLILVIAMIILVFPVSAISYDNRIIDRNRDRFIATDMSVMDSLITAGIYLSPVLTEENMTSEKSYLKEMIPLHDINSNIVAFYLTFTSGSYAVVNNNINNPTVIEFGMGDNPFVREILDSSINPVIVYNSPFDVFDKNGVAQFDERISEASIASLFDNYPDLLEPNRATMNLHSEARGIVSALYPQMTELDFSINELSSRIDGFNTQIITPFGGSDWGFLPITGLPTGAHTNRHVTGIPGSAVVMSTFSNGNTRNHCGAVAVTNLAMIFANQGHQSLRITNVYNTFRAIHPTHVGNGPVMMIAPGATNYFRSRNVTLRHSGIGTVAQYRTAIANNRPVGILLANGLFSWHWIVGVGYRHYTNTGITFFRVLDGWNTSNQRFYRPNTGSLWWSATSYWIG
ncbi:MAG: hypothetical protein FWC97_02285 [Treponema sp.]|nr:hypothetical protein [Treponema sp.]